jgi:hypothetical protein
MNRRILERAVVMVLGFFAGAMLAMSIAPGDVFLWLATGVVLGLFAHAFFVSSVAEEQAWPFTRHRRPYQGKKHRLR